MRYVSVRELRNNTGQVIASLDGGETVILTSNGREVGEIKPLSGRRKFVPHAELSAALGTPWDDPGLKAELAAMRDEMVDDLGAGLYDDDD